MKKILFILGPNLNMVGIRDKHIYGTETAESINEDVKKWAEEFNIEIEMEDITPENFDSVEAIWNLIQELKE